MIMKWALFDLNIDAQTLLISYQLFGFMCVESVLSGCSLPLPLFPSVGTRARVCVCGCVWIIFHNTKLVEGFYSSEFIEAYYDCFNDLNICLIYHKKKNEERLWEDLLIKTMKLLRCTQVSLEISRQFDLLIDFDKLCFHLSFLKPKQNLCKWFYVCVWFRLQSRLFWKIKRVYSLLFDLESCCIWIFHSLLRRDFSSSAFELWKKNSLTKLVRCVCVLCVRSLALWFFVLFPFLLVLLSRVTFITFPLRQGTPNFG